MLVGVDGSPAARVALEFAVREATPRDAVLVEDRRLYGLRWRRLADRLDGPLVEIALGP